MHKHLLAFSYALMLLSRMPLPQCIDNADFSSKEIQRDSIYWYAVVGLLIGGLLWAAYEMLLFLPGTSMLNAAIILSLWVLITGALHLDGLADTSDAWLGGFGDRQKTLDIMKDPRSGPAAIVAVVLLLLLKFSALSTLLAAPQSLSLWLTPLIARVAVSLLISHTHYARKQGLGNHLDQADKRYLMLLQALLVSLATFWYAGWSAAWLIAGLLILGLYLRRLMLQRLKGFTGDTAGAFIEVMEATALIGFCLI